MNTGNPSPQSSSTGASSAVESRPVENADPAVASAAQPRPVPKWIGFMVALAIVGSMLGGGGIWAWGYYNRPDPKNLVEVGGARLPVGISRSTVPAQPAFPPVAAGIRQVSPTVYQASAGDYQLTVNKPLIGTTWVVRMQYMPPGLLSPDQRAAIVARNRYPADPLFAKASKVEEEQVTKLKAVPALSINPPLALSTADQDKLRAAFTALIATRPAKAEDGQKFIAMIQEIGKNSLNPTRESIAESAKQIQAILTPEQIAPFK